MEIIYKTKAGRNNGVTITLVYTESNLPRNYRHIGTQNPKVTQCECYIDKAIVSIGTVVKHAKDEDSPNFAKRLVTKKVLDVIKVKEVRTELWKMVLDATK